LPKRKIKEAKPARRLGKKELLVVPIAMGGASLVALVIIPALAPPPAPWSICLKGHNIETFQLYPRVEVIVDGQSKLLPDSLGKHPRDGEECLRPIHVDEVGSIVHIEYIRPVTFTMDDFMKVYNVTNTLEVVDNSTGSNVWQTLNLTDYDIEYSYYSEEGEFTVVPKPSDVPPFPKDNMMVARVELTSK
jgi:hypothetical protein